MSCRQLCISLVLFLTPLAASMAAVVNPAVFPIVPRHFNGSEIQFRQWLQAQKVDVPIEFETVIAEKDGALLAVYVSNGSGIIGADVYVFSCGKEQCSQLLFFDRIVTRGHGAKGKLIVSFSKEKNEIVVKEDDGFVHALRKFRR